MHFMPCCEPDKLTYEELEQRNYDQRHQIRTLKNGLRRVDSLLKDGASSVYVCNFIVGIFKMYTFHITKVPDAEGK